MGFNQNKIRKIKKFLPVYNFINYILQKNNTKKILQKK